jgi:hypothetical protein
MQTAAPQGERAASAITRSSGGQTALSRSGKGAIESTYHDLAVGGGRSTGAMIGRSAKPVYRPTGQACLAVGLLRPAEVPTIGESF